MTAKKILMDGDANSDDRKCLADKRNELGLAADDARQLLKKAALATMISPQPRGAI